MYYALVCINNHVFSGLVSMLLDATLCDGGIASLAAML